MTNAIALTANFRAHMLVKYTGMRTKLDRKFWIFLLGGIVLVALLVLASGLPSLEFAEGRKLPLGNSSIIANPVRSLPIGDARWVKVIGVIFAIILPISLIYLILSKEARKRFLIQLIQVGLLVLALYLFMTRVHMQPPAVPAEEIGAPGIPTPGVEDIPQVEPVAATPSWLVNTLSICVSGVLLVGGLWIFRLMRSSIESNQQQDELVFTAQSALDEIRAGGDLSNIILRCYKEMTRIVAEKRNIKRQGYLTPSEFADQLSRAGLPKDQIFRLTQLFEAARYGARQANTLDEKEAVSCLTAVTNYLGSQP